MPEITRILYVEDNEDNEDNIYMLRRRLERKGIEVIVAQDGEQGIAAAARERPDLILMDLSLPVINGWEAARRLKSSPETGAIPIIALSAHAMTGDRERALAAGCDEYHTKPVDFGSLMAKIMALLPPGTVR